MKISKNVVSYFLAGYEAAMREMRVKDIRNQMYRSLEHPNKARKYLLAYDSKESDDEGLIAMHQYADKKFECPDREDGHRFIHCDEWPATCTCGKQENE